jgi:hypothetical protein
MKVTKDERKKKVYKNILLNNLKMRILYFKKIKRKKKHKITQKKNQPRTAATPLSEF